MSGLVAVGPRRDADDSQALRGDRNHGSVGVGAVGDAVFGVNGNLQRGAQDRVLAGGVELDGFDGASSLVLGGERVDGFKESMEVSEAEAKLALAFDEVGPEVDAESVDRLGDAQRAKAS